MGSRAKYGPNHPEMVFAGVRFARYRRFCNPLSPAYSTARAAVTSSRGVGSARGYGLLNIMGWLR
jgi:hypothetical protein